MALLARVDGDHHVLVAYADGDPLPAGVARFVRQGRAAEVAFAVADEHQGRRIGSAPAEALTADARAAGILEFHATVTGDNQPVISLLSRYVQAASDLARRWRAQACRGALLTSFEVRGESPQPSRDAAAAADQAARASLNLWTQHRIRRQTTRPARATTAATGCAGARGFLVETPTKRIGRVTGIRYGETTNEPEVLEVRAGLFGRTRLLISVDDITEIDPEQGLLTLADPPRPL